MRKGFGYLLLGLGFFALVLTVLLPTVVVSKSKKTPLDLNITQVSSGPGKILDSATLQTKEVQLRATRVVKTDTSASNGTNTTVLETLCIVIVDGNTPNCVTKDDPQQRLMSVSRDRVTADRKNAESVHVAKYGEFVENFGKVDTSVRHVGLSYKWPIDAKKQTYQFFQPDVEKAFPAVYSGTDKIAGLTVYKYVCDTGTQPYKVLGTLDGTYNDTRTVWVEPRTGAIIKGIEHQVQHITDTNDPTGPGILALDTTLTFDQSAIDYQANYAKDKINQLKMAQVWGPLITGILGVAALVGAYFLLRTRRAGGGDSGGEGRHGHPAPDDDPNYADPPVWAGSSQT
jgi:hypothetical protein